MRFELSAINLSPFLRPRILLSCSSFGVNPLRILRTLSRLKSMLSIADVAIISSSCGLYSVILILSLPKELNSSLIDCRIVFDKHKRNT